MRMVVIRTSASGTEHSVLAHEIAVWPNLTTPYRSGPDGLSELVLVDWGRGTHADYE